MVAGGDVPVRKPDGQAEFRPENPIQLRTENDSSLTRMTQDLYVKGPPPPKDPTIIDRFAGIFGNLAKKLFPDFFGIFGRVRVLPEEYTGFQYLAFDSGAQLFYNVENVEDDDGEIIVAASLYDLASFTHKLLSDPENWSVGAVADVIRKQGIPFGSHAIRIGPSSYDNSTGLYKISMRADGGVSFDSFHIRFHEVAEILDELKEYEIEETAKSSSASDIVAALQKALRGVRPRYSADVEMMLPMEADDSRFGGESIGRVDAGVRLGPDGKITAITLRIMEREQIAQRFGAPFLFENESLWIGRINGSVISWEIENSDPTNVNIGLQAAVFDYIPRLFRTNVTHILKGSGRVKGGGGPVTSAGGASQGAPEEITAADEAAADEDETDEEIDEATNFDAGYEDADTFDTSFGVFIDGFAFDPMPVI